MMTRTTQFLRFRKFFVKRMDALGYIIAVVFVVALTGCEKELDFEYHDIDPITVIEANLDQDGAAVAITMTTPMDEPVDGSKVTDATVVLTDMTDSQVYRLYPGQDGVYRNDVGGLTGHDYRITVERGGAKYEATSGMLPPVEIRSLEFNWIKMPYDHVAVLQITFTDNPEISGECYWVQLFRNGEAYMWSEVSDVLAVNGLMDVVIMTTRKDVAEEDEQTVLYDGDVMTVSVLPIDRSMHDYLEALGNGTNGPAMFSGDFCLGYFLAAPVVSSSIEFHPSEIPEFE